MFNYIKAEFFRITKRKYLYTVFGLCIGLTFLINYLFLSFINRGNMQREQTMFMELSYPIVAAMQLGIIMIVVISSLTLLDNFATGSVRNSICIGTKRIEIIISGVLVTVFYGILFVVLVMGSLFIGGIIVNGGFNEYAAFLIKLVSATFLQLFPIYLFYVLVISALQQMTNQRSTVITFSLLIYYIGKAVAQILMKKYPKQLGMLTDYVPQLLEDSAAKNFMNVALSVESSKVIPASYKILESKSLIFMGGCIVVMLALNYILSARKEY